MNISYIVITDGENPNRIVDIAKSIYDTHPLFTIELVVVGGEFDKDVYHYIGEGYKHIPFDETKKANHITKKKNIGVEAATNEICVIMHDYVAIGKNFYQSMKHFGNDWDVAMCRIENMDGSRFRDWVSWSNPDRPIRNWTCREKWCKKGIQFCNAWNNEEYDKPNPYFAIPGIFWIAKRSFMLENPLDEKLVHKEGEDIEWSLRIRDKAKYVMNPNTYVRFLKHKLL